MLIAKWIVAFVAVMGWRCARRLRRHGCGKDAHEAASLGCACQVSQWTDDADGRLCRHSLTLLSLCPTPAHAAMVLGRRCGSVALLDEPCTRANLSPHCMTRPGVRRRGLPSARLRSSATSWLAAQRRTPGTSEPRKSSRSTCDFPRMVRFLRARTLSFRYAIAALSLIPSSMLRGSSPTPCWSGPLKPSIHLYRRPLLLL